MYKRIISVILSLFLSIMVLGQDPEHLWFKNDYKQHKVKKITILSWDMYALTNGEFQIKCEINVDTNGNVTRRIVYGNPDTLSSNYYYKNNVLVADSFFVGRKIRSTSSYNYRKDRVLFNRELRSLEKDQMLVRTEYKQLRRNRIKDWRLSSITGSNS